MRIIEGQMGFGEEGSAHEVKHWFGDFLLIDAPNFILTPFLIVWDFEINTDSLFPHDSDKKSLVVKPGVQSSKRATISAVNKTGLGELRALIEEGVMASTGREIKRLIIPPDGPQLRWDWSLRVLIDRLGGQVVVRGC